jgi:hypothetical protein
VIPKDVEFVIPRYNWTILTKYKQYDDAVPLEQLLSSSDNSEPMYVINLDGDVYKCLSNNVGGISDIEPTGNFTENDGFIQTADGYVWKYMYNVKRSNKFLTDEWLPVPYIQPNTDYTLYNYNSNSVIEGTLNAIVITNAGEEYYHTTLNVEPFLSGTNEIVISDNIDLTTSNTININMSVSGTGLLQNRTHITQIDPLKPTTLILSQPTISAGGGNVTSNLISILTRVDIIGDGTDTITTVELSSNNTLLEIEVVNAGVDENIFHLALHRVVQINAADTRVIVGPHFHIADDHIHRGETSIERVGRLRGRDDSLA